MLLSAVSALGTVGLVVIVVGAEGDAPAEAGLTPCLVASLAAVPVTWWSTGFAPSRPAG